MPAHARTRARCGCVPAHDRYFHTADRRVCDAGFAAAASALRLRKAARRFVIKACCRSGRKASPPREATRLITGRTTMRILTIPALMATAFLLAGCFEGPQGPIGPQGSRGPAGDTGDRGPPGRRDPPDRKARPALRGRRAIRDRRVIKDRRAIKVRQGRARACVSSHSALPIAAPVAAPSPATRLRSSPRRSASPIHRCSRSYRHPRPNADRPMA